MRLREKYNAHPLESTTTLTQSGSSGDPAPSPEDDALTARLRESGNLVGIPLLDHVIVGRPGYFSYDEEGWPSLK